ncbi:hypothetical protein AYX14_01438 [Cryptococcus neoformans]|nr:hypothetical protein AYX15_00634 [Cryptococcus neoformans var. grubii]OWZ73182.1 hypothetical protein AYX14_01438 [Cryptococcus neoformans var. grubii]OWZ80614.1 hypothetical protein C365_00435 [Cryptococcus neoformans var. grubii Bt85]OXG23538.1 hypothetical protein C366_00437 [Cryptococcus neoformans var. grubii Tu401-1]OXM81471.1 hypothetical protein C364_00437 [Cryptococcus neoformans var. grubii Bt63]
MSSEQATTAIQSVVEARPINRRTESSTSIEGVFPNRMTMASSSATLCQLGEHDDKQSMPDVEHPPSIPEQASGYSKSEKSQVPTRQSSTKHSHPHSHSHQHQGVIPPVPSPDVVSVFDPASIGGGGPLKRIETQRSERYAEEMREKEAREADKSEKKSGILRRWSTVSRRRPVMIMPPHTHRHSEDEISPVDDDRDHKHKRLSSNISHQTLAITPTPDEREKYGFPDDKEEGSCEAGKHVHEEEVEEHVYPDGGYGWVVLGACCCLAGCTMGWGMNWGVFQEYYLDSVYPDSNTSVLSLAGTLCAFMMNATAFISGRYGDRYGFKRVLYCSAVITWLGLFLAGWSTKLWQTILTQGILTGFGQGLSLPLFMSLPSQWFYRRRGLASGLAIGGAGLGGGTTTLICRELLTRVGYRKTLWILACINLFCMSLSTFLIRTRPTSPEGKATGKGPWIDWAVVKTSSFWSLVIGLVVSTTGYAMPFNFTAQWTRLHCPNLDTILLALPVTLLGYTVCIGRALIGLVADFLGPMNTFILCFFLSGVVQLCLWLTASSFASVLVFAVVFGLVAPGYMGIIPQIIVQLFGPTNLATNVGILLLFNGPGNLMGGPIGGALFDASGRTSFKYMIITSGCLQIAGGLITCWARFKTSRKWRQKI